MHEGRAAEVCPEFGRGVESSASIADATKTAVIAFGEEHAGVKHFEPNSEYQQRAVIIGNQYAARLMAVLAPVLREVARLGELVSVLKTHGGEHDAGLDGEEGDQIIGLGPRASELPDPIPRSAILPSVQPAGFPTENQAARAVRVLGGNPLDLAAKLLHDLEIEARCTATEGDRLALAIHMQVTARELLKGTTHRVEYAASVERLSLELESDRAALKVVSSERRALRATIAAVRSVACAHDYEGTVEAVERIVAMAPVGGRDT